MNIFKKLFGSQTTSKETKQEENKNFDVLKYDGVRALRMQQFDYAAKCFVLALELNADDLECRDYLSQAYISLGDLEPAYEQLQKISEKQSDNIAVLLRMAEVAYMMENYSTMADVCEKALLLDDKNVMAYYLYAKAYHGQGDLNNATSMLTKAIELRADFDVARLLRGNVLLENKAIEEAALDANYLYERIESNEDVLLLKARVEKAKANLNEAEKIYSEVIDFDPFSIEAYKNAARYVKASVISLGRLRMRRELTKWRQRHPNPQKELSRISKRKCNKWILTRFFIIATPSNHPIILLLNSSSFYSYPHH